MIWLVIVLYSKLPIQIVFQIKLALMVTINIIINLFIFDGMSGVQIGTLAVVYKISCFNFELISRLNYD